MKSSDKNLPIFLYLIVFIISGFAGLIYQSIWSHYLSIFLGHAAYAQALVLSLFMGGMALGAHIASQKVLKWRNLFLIYAIIEAVIGILAFTFHPIFITALTISFDFVIPSLNSSFLVDGYKLGLTALLILPQTILLGMTFPIMCSALIKCFTGRDGNTLGSLYFANSIGAALGVLSSAFIFLPSFGLKGAIIIAGFLNLFVCLLALILSKKKPLGSTIESNNINNLSSPSDEKLKRLLPIILMATFLSSAASFAYEIIFVRLLSLAVGSTLQAFEVMLAAFISGIAFGSLWIRKHANSTKFPLKLAGWLQVWMGLTALLALVFYSGSFSWVGYLVTSLAITDGGYNFFIFGTATIAIIIMFPTAFFAGTTLPLFTVALLKNGHNQSVIGKVYAFNTLGAILGVFAAIHFLIPVLGLKLAMFFSALVDISIGLVIIRLLTKTKKDYFKLISITASSVIFLSCFSLFLPYNVDNLSSGVFRSGISKIADDREVIFYKDGKTASVSVIYSHSNTTISVATNGKVDAAIQLLKSKPPTLDEPTMILLGALPLAYKPDAEDVAVIGFGSGLTSHTLLGSDIVQNIDTIEIEPAMVESAVAFNSLVSRAFDDPRSKIHIDDAKSYFSSQNKKYDIIISEPSNPWVSGIGSLFSKEFYRYITRHLNEEGIFVQWLQLYEIDDELVSSVIRALTPEFNKISAYLSNSTDLIIIASKNNLNTEPNFDYILSGQLGESLSSIGLINSNQLSSRKVADKEILNAIGNLYVRYPANSDYFPILSLHAPKTRFQRQTANTLRSLPTFNLPFLEFLNIKKTNGLELYYPTYNHLDYDTLANQARYISEQIITNSDEVNVNLKSEVALWLQSLKKSNINCWNNSESYSLYLSQNLYHLTALTLPYLNSAGLEYVLYNPSWIACNNLPNDISDLFKIIEYISKRDFDKIVESGNYWLNSINDRKNHFTNFDSLIFVAVHLTLVSQGKYAEAENFLAEHKMLELSNEDALMSVILKAYTDLK